MEISSYSLTLPQWTSDFFIEENEFYPSLEERMALVIKLSANNIKNNGGPFGAAVFERKSGRLIAPGINLVLQTNCSVVHAEIVAIILAQQKMATFDLGVEGLPEYELVTTTEPCAMCLGAIPWSGISSLVCGARDADARNIGFDEGDKPEEWIKKLESRSIAVTRDILRDQARAVMQKYIDQGGIIYNGKQRSKV